MERSKNHFHRVEWGKVVIMEYRVRLSSGKIVDSSKKSGGPVSFVCGSGDFPRPVEEGLIGLPPGAKTIIKVLPDFTYGPYDPKKVTLIAQERIIEKTVETGKVIKILDEFGIEKPALVRAVWEGAIMLDFNHPLAGEILHFEINIRDVRSPSENPIDEGRQDYDGQGVENDEQRP